MRDLKAATWTWQVNPCSALYAASNLNKKTNYLLCTYVESCVYYICGVMWVLHMWSPGEDLGIFIGGFFFR